MGHGRSFLASTLQPAHDMLARENSGFSVDASARRHKAANWVGPGRGRKSTRPGAGGVVELSALEFLNRLANFVPPPRKHRHRSHGVFAPNHKLRRAVTALAMGNVAKQCAAASFLPLPLPRGEGRGEGASAEGARQQKPRGHDTSRIARATLMARVGEEFPLECPWVWRRHPLDRVHHGAGADPEDSEPSGRSDRAAANLAGPWTAHRLGRACAGR